MSSWMPAGKMESGDGSCPASLSKQAYRETWLIREIGGPRTRYESRRQKDRIGRKVAKNTSKTRTVYSQSGRMQRNNGLFCIISLETGGLLAICLAVLGLSCAATMDKAVWEGHAGMSWFKREDNEIVNDSEKTVRTEGLWIRCPDCGKILFKAELEANQKVCWHCGHHFRIDARTRIENLLEPGYELVDLELRSTDPLNFTDLKPYKRRLAEAQQKTGLNDAIVNAIGLLGPHSVVLSVMEYSFIGG